MSGNHLILAQARAVLPLCIAVCLACKPAAPAAARAPVPTTRATVITARTTVKPEKSDQNRQIVIVGSRARDVGEADVWRLFDTKANTVTFVDEISRTVRTETLQSLIAERRSRTEAPLPSHYPSPRFLRSDETRTILGVPARKVTIESGAYKRELWIGEHSAIPRGLFALMVASDPPTPPLGAMMRAVDDGLLSLGGYPLSEHVEVPLAKEMLIVDRVVLSVAAKDVPSALITVPAGYRDLTPKRK